MRPRISFVTNATSADGVRLEKFLPHVLNVFDGLLDELIVIVDLKPEQGRILKLHSKVNYETRSMEDIISIYSSAIVRFEILDYRMLNDISQLWFGQPKIDRCQSGTPIFAFLYGIEKAKNDFILRSDCDILFYDKGMLKEAVNKAENYDLIQLPFLDGSKDNFSTRCFFLNRMRVHKKLPLNLYKLDFFRRIHRKLRGRPVVMALEQIVQREVERGRLEACTLSTDFGNTMHIARRSDFVGIDSVIDKFANGHMPQLQRNAGHDFIPYLWHDQQEREEGME